jgi:hypothetical protein
MASLFARLSFFGRLLRGYKNSQGTAVVSVSFLFFSSPAWAVDLVIQNYKPPNTFLETVVLLTWHDFAAFSLCVFALGLFIKMLP